MSLHAAANPRIAIEPEFVRDRDGADVLAAYPRTFAELVPDIQRLEDAIEKYGFSFEQLGPKLPGRNQ